MVTSPVRLIGSRCEIDAVAGHSADVRFGESGPGALRGGAVVGVISGRGRCDVEVPEADIVGIGKQGCAGAGRLQLPGQRDGDVRIAERDTRPTAGIAAFADHERRSGRLGCGVIRRFPITRPDDSCVDIEGKPALGIGESNIAGAGFLHKDIGDGLPEVESVTVPSDHIRVANRKAQQDHRGEDCKPQEVFSGGYLIAQDRAQTQRHRPGRTEKPWVAPLGPGFFVAVQGPVHAGLSLTAIS